MSACRILLIPLLVLCVSPSPPDPLLPAPAIPVVLVLVVGLSTGYVGTLAMIMAPASTTKEQKELTGGMIRAFLNALPMALGLELWFSSAENSWYLSACLVPSCDFIMYVHYARCIVCCTGKSKGHVRPGK